MSYLEPAFPLLLLLAFAGVLRTWRRSPPRHQPRLALISLIAITLLSSNWVAWGLSRPLETRIPQVPTPTESADAIVVLSGAVDRPTSAQPYSTVGVDTYRRLQHAVWLFNAWKPLPILVCGGIPDDGQPPMADSMRSFLIDAGLPASQIWTESRSGSTHENALYGAEVLRAHGVSRVALVVEASSMPRAAAAFEKVGIHVVPAAIRFTRLDGDITDVLPGWRAIARNGETLHEMLGLVWYRLRGWI